VNKEDLYKLYEKVYFHQMDVRDKLVSRAQINFAFIAGVLSIITYMLKVLDYEQESTHIFLFYTFVFITLAYSVVPLFHIIRAFWGNEYISIDNPKLIDEYRDQELIYIQQTVQYNKGNPCHQKTVDVIDDDMEAYLYDMLRDASSLALTVNIKRSKHLHTSFKWIMFLTIPFVISGLLFIFGNLDVSSPRKETPIVDKLLSANLNKIDQSIKELSKNMDKYNKELIKNIQVQGVIEQPIESVENVNNNLATPIEVNPKKQTPQRVAPKKPKRPKNERLIKDDTPKPEF
jgi:hypothetical protein